ncbi:hypothetical protein AXK56_22630 [Tsukamurella pulmonis]|uniref:Uncharacterized protein n=1 Tax=Tsukamurella pulmonis TaxID=47312 RepID=A0A1H1AE47_9ACTN|nr:hypothetical protein [Tsukamurella pulmonis]KXO92804.1 hypothetical protein AXK56_22630 [Tsukamurella pulmonis]SDQ37907.1 hypothetical protein SAMN04489765_0179 [Tsukamurella pulmonis]SUQ39357.1 Uncharacterised protein [Tsukamurella pulmonis]
MDVNTLLGSTGTKILAALTRRTLDGYEDVDLTDLIKDTGEPRTTVRRAVEDLAERGEVDLVRAGRRALSVKLAATPAVLAGLEHRIETRQGPRYAGQFYRTEGPYDVDPWHGVDYKDHPELVVHADLELPGEQYTDRGTLPITHARILADHIERILIPLWSVEPALQGAFRVGHSDRARALCRWALSSIGALPTPHIVLRHAAGYAERSGHHSIGVKAELRVALDLKLAAARLTRWAEDLHELTRAAHQRDDEAREVAQLRGQLLATAADDDPRYREHLAEQIQVHERRLAAAREGLILTSERTSGFGGPADDVGNAGEALLSGLFDRVAQNLTEVAESDF